MNAEFYVQVGDANVSVRDIANKDQMEQALALVAQVRDGLYPLKTVGITVAEAAQQIEKLGEPTPKKARTRKKAEPAKDARQIEIESAIDSPKLMPTGTVEIVLAEPMVFTLDPAAETRALVDKKGIAAATALLAEFGIKRVSELPEDKRAAFVAAARARIAA